ncbi:MAG: hypothetical protein Q7U73_05910 [Rubrivivax sp.]|nr:hypothetical protein [Rubrivivax sp.]
MNLHSSLWHRVAGLKPRLVPQLRVRRQQVRGQTWIVLGGAGGGRSVRMDRQAWTLAARLDGRCTLQQLWDRQLAAGDPPTQDELIELLAQLREAALLQFERGADFDRLLPHLDRTDRPPASRSLLAWRVPLADPSALLDLLQRHTRWLFTAPVAWLWAAVVIGAVLLALQHAGALWAHGERWLATPRYALLAALVWLPLKLLHELAHGLAVRHWGGHVREAGVTFMFGMPMPYVDASAAATFVRRRRRVVVGAAGMMVELAIAAAALCAWLTLDDGWARDLAFVTLFVCGISALVFNANPLQRLDGYFIACDLLGLPNLALRSRRWWHERLLGWLAPAVAPERMPLARGEAPWLAVYAPLSWACMLLICALAVFWLGSVSFLLGALAGMLLGWQLVAMPAVRLLAPLARAARSHGQAAGRARRASAAAVALGVVVLAVPLPRATVLQGVVWPPELAQLRSEEEGFVESVFATDGQPVDAGAPVMRLANPRLVAELTRQRAEVDALEARLYGALPADALGDGGAAADAGLALDTARAALDRLVARVDALTVRARTSGRLALPGASDLEGRYVERGRLLGQVVGPAPPTVRAALPESEAAALGSTPRTVSVRLAATPHDRHVAQVVHAGGGAGQRLPSAALSQRHGGAIATDPHDSDALQPARPVVLLDVQLAAPASARLGERAWVRVDTGHSPLAWQALGAGRRALLERFNAGF